MFNEVRSFHTRCEVNTHCEGHREYCNTAIERCECQQFYEYRFANSDCSLCPGEGEQCMDCCSDTNLKCIYGICSRCDNDSYECDNSRNLFMNASQIALVAALLMGAAALATLLYRICTKPSVFRSRRLRLNRNAEANESDLQREMRSSLSSIQIRVISRLRDRPPKYETQHNYDTRIQRQEEEIERTDGNTNLDINTIRVGTVEHAPPPYDGSHQSMESVHESPPPYSDTGHDILPDIVIANRNTSSQIGNTSQNSSISIISNACSASDVINENKNQSDNKDDKSIHM